MLKLKKMYRSDQCEGTKWLHEMRQCASFCWWWWSFTGRIGIARWRATQHNTSTRASIYDAWSTAWDKMMVAYSVAQLPIAQRLSESDRPCQRLRPGFDNAFSTFASWRFAVNPHKFRWSKQTRCAPRQNSIRKTAQVSQVLWRFQTHSQVSQLNTKLAISAQLWRSAAVVCSVTFLSYLAQTLTAQSQSALRCRCVNLAELIFERRISKHTRA